MLKFKQMFKKNSKFANIKNIKNEKDNKRFITRY